MARHVAPPATDLVTATRDGLWRVAGTRVSVDSIALAFRDGATPEQILQDHDSLSLAQVYGVVHLYLAHRRVMDAYLREQDRLDKSLARKLKTEHGTVLAEIRRRLDARRRRRDRAASAASAFCSTRT